MLPALVPIQSTERYALLLLSIAHAMITILLASFIMGSITGGPTEVRPCIHLPIDTTNQAIEVVLEYGEWYSDSQYLRFIARSVRPLTLTQQSQHCFGPYHLRAGIYSLIVTVGNQNKRLEFQVVGDER